MLLPLWLLAAYVAKLGYELMVDPILPVEAGNSAGLFLILTAAFLAEYELLVLLRLFRKDGDPPVLTRMLPGLPLLCYLLLLAFGDWLAFVRYQIGVQGLALTEFLDLAPFFFFQCLGLLGSLRVYGRTGLAWQRLQGSMLIAPMLFLLLGLQDLLLLHPLSRAAILELPGVFECSVGLSSILVAVVFPLLFILVVARKKLPQKDVGDALFALAKRARVGVRQIRVWETGMLMINAAVLGPVRWTRQVIFTDLILACFKHRQIMAVFAHELAHIKRRHFLKQALFFCILPLLLAFTLLREDDTVAWQIALLFAVLLVLLPVFSFLAHRFEHEADLFGARILGSYDDMISALEEVDNRFPAGKRTASLRHPSTERRIEFLARAAEDPDSLSGWFRKSKAVQSVLYLALGICIGLALPRLREDSRLGYPSFLLSSGYASSAHEELQAVEPSDDSERLAWQAAVEDASRAMAMCILHGDSEGPKLVPTLRSRALKRGWKALRNRQVLMNKPRNRPSNRHSDANRTADREDYDRVALAWFRLAQRWGSYDQLLAAMELFLQSTLDDDHEGTRRSVLLLRLLPSLPKLDKSVGLLLKRES